MRLLAVILHYGNPDMTAALRLGLVQADPLRQDDIRVLDNAAPLPFASAWRREPKNRYWAGALELCLDLARTEQYTHLWFLNNDIRFFRPPALTAVEARLSRLDKAFSRPAGLWSPAMTVNPYHPHMCPAVKTSGLVVRQVRLLDCAAPVLRIEAVDDVGGLDAHDNPRGYGVDMWLSLRMSAQSWPVLVDQEMVVRHRAHTTARAVSGFMRDAALAEEAFCTARLGPQWRTRLEAIKREDIRPETLYPVSSGVCS